MRGGANCYMNSETYNKCGDVSNLNIVIYDESYCYSEKGYVEGNYFEGIPGPPLDTEFKYYIPTNYAVFKNDSGYYGMKIVDD